MTSTLADIRPGYDRITSILSHFSGFDHVPSFILERAKERGTAVHKMFEEMSTGKQPQEFNPAYQGYYDSLCKWMERKNFLFPLDRLYNDKLMITGMIDGIYESDDGLVLFDLKTSASIGKTWTEQLGGYLTLLDNTSITINKVEVIKIEKEGKDPYVIDIEKNLAIQGFYDCWKIFFRFFKGKESIDIEKL
jgi:hypothetical protein